MNEKKKYGSTMEWWAAEENKDKLDQYLGVLEDLAETLEFIKAHQKETVDEEYAGVDAPADMLRCLIDLLREQVVPNSKGMMHALLQLKHLSEAMLAPVQISVAVEKSIEIFKEMQGPPPGVRAAIENAMAAALGCDPDSVTFLDGDADANALGDVLRERMKKSVEDEEETEVKGPADKPGLRPIREPEFLSPEECPDCEHLGRPCRAHE